MEEMKVEELEPIEVEKTEYKEAETQPKQFEKLLALEADREDNEKALTLIKYGCFEEAEVQEIDYSELVVVQAPKKLKGLYTLYRKKNTNELLYVCPLLENNKGDKDENKDMKPYAYSVIYLDTMDNETLEMVKKAGSNNSVTLASFLYKTAFISYCIYAAWSVFVFICVFIDYIGTSFQSAYTNATLIAGTPLGIAIAALPLLVLMVIKYRKYKGQ